jgi:hypothetical protein
MRIRLSLMLMSFVVAACSSQGAAPATAPATSSASAPAAAAAAPTGSSCDFDYKKMCQQYIDRPQITYNGVVMQTNRLSEQMGRHPQIVLPISDDSGSVVMTVECRYSADQGTNKVISGGLQSGATPDAKAVQYAQSKGLCGSGVDYTKEIAHQEERQMNH